MSDNINSDGNHHSNGNCYSNGNYCLDGNYHSNGNYYADSNHHSNGNCYSNGNYCLDGNCYSDGNYRSNGNCYSDGNYLSHGNYRSDGNYNSYGNYYSHGNYRSDGNNGSNGNYYSLFMYDCFGTCRSVLCKGKKGVANMILNQQVSEEEATEFRTKIMAILGDWLPYVTDYVMSGMSADGAYHYAWSKCPKKEEIVQLIKDTSYLDTKKAMKVFTDITGIVQSEIDDKTEEAMRLLKKHGYKVIRDTNNKR